MNANASEAMRVFLCGDVMTGRGIDQVLPHPNDPELHEPAALDARHYVHFAERANGPIPKPVSFDYIWGDALAELELARVDVRIANLETSITTSSDFWPDKFVHYRMHPRNVECLKAAKLDCCCLANNHVMDWGYSGLDETLRTLDTGGLRYAGAGRNIREAAAPATINIASKGRVLVFSFGSDTSGIPSQWAAGESRAGVHLLDDLSTATARRVADKMRGPARTGDILIASIHWGDNWGYEVYEDQTRFAHCLIDEGVAIVHGHSSHHVRPIEVYHDRLILYGCGDFINDYEGIAGYETFRDDLTFMYLVDIELSRSRVVDVSLIPMQIRRFRLQRASAADARWLCDLLNRIGSPARLKTDNTIALRSIRKSS